jgi:hypothetical protein
MDSLMPLLAERYEVRVREGRWNISSPGASKNVSTVLEQCPTGDGDGEWYILGNSFGNRVICSMLSDSLFPVPPRKIVMCGYPMYSDKGTDERVKLLQALPVGSNVLCISGDRDGFLRKGPSGRSKSTAEVYEAVIASLPCRAGVSLRMLPGGGHSVLDGAACGPADAAQTVLDWVTEFTTSTPAGAGSPGDPYILT